MYSSGFHLLEQGLADLCDPISREELCVIHPLWKSSVASFIDSKSTLESAILVAGKCSSTMNISRHLLEQGEISSWDAVLATEQESGRGQLRRPWVSPAGNIYLSLCWPALPVDGAWKEAMPHLLTLVMGWVVCQSLQSFGAHLSIKWPNDLLQNNRKVGGLLVEERGENIILGIGLNIASSPPDSLMREESSVVAGCLRLSDPIFSILHITEGLVVQCKKIYTELLDQMSPTEFITLLTSKLAWSGQEILVCEGGDSSYRATLMGVDISGGLILYGNGERKILVSGSIMPV